MKTFIKATLLLLMLMVSIQPAFSIDPISPGNQELNDIIISPPRVPIPEGYQCYVLFLFPSAEWIDKNKNAELSSLFDVFKNFGEAIGNRRAAIWFTKWTKTDVDINRSKEYCDKFSLNYNDGPYIIVIGKHPAEISTGNVVVIKLSNISTSRITSILNILEQDLRTERQIQKRALLFEEVKQRLLSAVDRHGKELKDIGIKLVFSK